MVKAALALEHQVTARRPWLGGGQ